MADSLVTANLWGHPSHGMLRLGLVRRAAAVRRDDGGHRAILVVDHGALAVLDGHDGVGQVLAAATACDDAVRRAREHGVGVVAVRKQQPLRHRRVLDPPDGPRPAAWASSPPTAARPWRRGAAVRRRSAPTRGRSRRPAGRARSRGARHRQHRGRARQDLRGAQRDETIPADWAIDRDGDPTTDPRHGHRRRCNQPMAGHKGYGISFMMDVLSGVLTGSSSAPM